MKFKEGDLFLFVPDRRRRQPHQAIRKHATISPEIGQLRFNDPFVVLESKDSNTSTYLYILAPEGIGHVWIGDIYNDLVKLT